MKRLLLAALLLLCPNIVFGQTGGGTGTKSVTTELRTARFIIPRIHFPTIGVPSTAVGSEGVIMRASLHSGLSHVTQTTSIAALPYPAKLDVAIIDQDANGGAMYCPSLTLYGYDQFGNAINERFSGTSSISEFPRETTNVFEQVTRVDATCNNGTAGGVTTSANDMLRISVSGEVGLPFRITGPNAVLSVCITDNSASGATVCYKPGSSDAAGVFDNVGAAHVNSRTLATSGSAGALGTAGNRIDYLHHSIELDGLTTAIANDDDVIIRLRAPNGRQ